MARFRLGAVTAAVVLAGSGWACGSSGGRLRTGEEAAGSGGGASLTTTAPCPAASMTVQSVSGERLHPDVLPAGFALTSGSEDDLNSMAQLVYSRPGGGDVPRVQLSRVHATAPLEQLTSGGHQPVTVQGLPGLLSDGGPGGDFRNVSWEPAAGTAIIATGYKIAPSDLVNVAQH